MGLTLRSDFERKFTICNNESTRMGISIEQTTRCFGKCSFRGAPQSTDYSILGTTSHYKSDLCEKWHHTIPDGQEIIVKKGKDYQKALWRENKSAPWKILGYDGQGLSFFDIKINKSLPKDIIDLTSYSSKVSFPYNHLSISPEFRNFEALKGLTKNQCSMLKNTIKGILRFI